MTPFERPSSFTVRREMGVDPTAIVSLLITLIAGCRPPSETSSAQLLIANFVLEEWKFVGSVVGLVGTAAALVFGFRQYRRSEQWKRAEFVAREMKDFLGEPRVRLALTLCDWGEREVNLLEPTKTDSTSRTYVTRELQCSALVPHPLARGGDLSQQLATASEGARDSGDRRFTSEEAAIRDAFDALLDGLEQFGSFLSSNLVRADDLKAYIGYWIDDIAAPTSDPREAEWCVCLLTYVQFYEYINVQCLFEAFDRNIRVGGAHYLSFVGGMTDEDLAKRLRETIAQNPIATST